MKKKLIISLIIIVVVWFLFAMTTPAKADTLRIQSPKGMSQSAWEATPEYQAFKCPEGYGRGVGVDMNFTTDRSDDYYWVQCEKINIVPVAPKPVVDTAIVTPSVTIVVETKTVAVVVGNVNNNSTPSDNTVVQNNSTVQSVVQIQQSKVDTTTQTIASVPTITATLVEGKIEVKKEVRPIYRRVRSEILGLLGRVGL